MTGTVNLREVILGILMEVTEQEAYSHIALRDTLDSLKDAIQELKGSLKNGLS